MDEADSYRKKTIRRQIKGRVGGKVAWQVQSSLNPVSFKREKDAKAFKNLLLAGVHPISSDIVRRESDEDGYELT